MIKKIFPFFLVFILLVVIFSFLKKSSTTVTNQSDDEPKNTSGIGGKENESKTLTANPQKIFLQVDEPKNNTTVNSSTLKITGSTLPESYVFVNDQELKADLMGNFETEVILDEGENVVIIVVSDEFGNSAEKDIVVTLESK